MVTRRALLAMLAAVVGLALGWSLTTGEGGGIALPLRRQPPPLPGPLPRIGLDRIAGEAHEEQLGRRDLFAFGPERPIATPTPAPTPPTVVAPTTATPPPTRVAPPQAEALPALQVSFIGAVDGPKGLKVAVLLAEGREVLTGREGDLVANRLEIVKIGLESVDVKDVGSDRVRRLPLEGAR